MPEVLTPSKADEREVRARLAAVLGEGSVAKVRALDGSFRGLAALARHNAQMNNLSSHATIHADTAAIKYAA